jgi:NAD(P)H-hydrate epimerase
MNGLQKEPYIVAVDGPTGLDYDTGALDDAAIPADLTVTFAHPKVGHFRFPGAAALGELDVADIGTDPGLADKVTLQTATAGLVRSWLPPRPPDAHKGTFGKALIVAGSVNYTGAAYLAGAAATRAGAGLVTLALPSVIHSSVAARLTEATYLLLPHELGVIAAGATRVLSEQIPSYDALLLGPGLGQERETRTFVEALLDGKEKHRYLGFGNNTERAEAPTLPPLVIDADGLNILATMEDWPKRLPPGSVLTPHPGEMARLMGCSAADVQADRLAVARSQASAWNHIVVLKGAYTIIAAPDGKAIIIPFANPGLATAGTGDVLAGTIVSLRAQGVDGFAAATVGAYLHGLAGELAREEIGTAGMVAGDVLAHLPQAWQRVNNA